MPRRPPEAIPGVPSPANYERPGDQLLFSLAVTLFSHSPDGILVVDEQGLIHMANRQCELMTAYPLEELIGSPVEILIPEERRELHAGHRANFIAEPRMRPMGVNLDLRLRRKNGAEVSVDINLAPAATSGGMYVIATIRRFGASGS